MTKQTITVREFQKEDIEAVHRLIHHVVDISYSGVYPEEALKLYRNYHSCENILNDADKGYCVVAEQDDEIVGTGILVENTVKRVYINPSVQKSGIGSIIYHALEVQATKTGFSSIDLSASLVARDFWEKCGFSVDHEEAIPAGDEVLKFYMMTKQLSNNNPNDR